MVKTFIKDFMFFFGIVIGVVAVINGAAMLLAAAERNYGHGALIVGGVSFFGLIYAGIAGVAKATGRWED